MEKHSEAQSNRDLLQLERGTNSLEDRLRVIQQSSSDAKRRMPTTSVPESSGMCSAPVKIVLTIGIPILFCCTMHTKIFYKFCIWWLLFLRRS